MSNLLAETRDLAKAAVEALDRWDRTRNMAREKYADVIKKDDLTAEEREAYEQMLKIEVRLTGGMILFLQQLGMVIGAALDNPIERKMKITMETIEE